MRYLRAIISIFKKKKIKFLGRAGLHFFHEGKTYFIDSELVAAKDFDIILYGGGVDIVEGNKKTALPDIEAKAILEKVKQELWNMGIRYKISDTTWH